MDHFNVRSASTEDRGSQPQEGWVGYAIAGAMVLFFIFISVITFSEQAAKRFSFRLHLDDDAPADSEVMPESHSTESAAGEQEEPETSAEGEAGPSEATGESAIREDEGDAPAAGGLDMVVRGQRGSRVFTLTNKTPTVDKDNTGATDNLSRGGTKLGGGSGGAAEPNFAPLVQILDRDDDGVPLIDINQAPAGELAALPRHRRQTLSAYTRI